MRLLKQLDGTCAAGRIVLAVQLAQLDGRAVMQLDQPGATFGVVDLDLFVGRNELQILQPLLMLFAVAVALARIVLIIEGHAWADNIQDRRSMEAHGGLEQLAYLASVACK